MKDRLATFISTIIILIILAIIGLLGYIGWQNIKNLDVAKEPEEFQTQSTNLQNTVDTETIQTPKIVENNNPFNYGDSEKNVDYSKVTVDKYFYNQLDDDAKTIYKAFESNKEKMKTGTYQVDFGNTFNKVLNSSNGQKELAQDYQSAIEAYTYDNPDVFYLSPNKLYLNIETSQKSDGNVYNVYINNGNEPNYLIDEFSNESQVNSALNQVEQVRDEIISRRTGNTYNDIKMVHDYLVDNTTYDTTISKPNIYNMYGALINKTAVCEGYARAFKYIMDGMNIPTVLIIGKGTNNGQTENHAWDYVSINNRWYAIDCTWDDPVVSGGGRVSQGSKYKYFLKGSNTFSNDHTPNGQFTPDGKIFEYPNLSEGDL